jgi:hypothetical protein
MSRRHRGRPHHHAPAGGEALRRGSGPEASAPNGPESNVPRTAAAAPPRITNLTGQRGSGPPGPKRSPHEHADAELAQAAPIRTASSDLAAATGDSHADAVGAAVVPTPPPTQGQNGERNGQCTAPQLRRFIKSRPYVPMHELRRRFAINGEDDDVTPVRMSPGWIYVGLPTHEGHLLGDLLRTGEIGYELSLDPRTPIVIGVYPMRPIPRT